MSTQRYTVVPYTINNILNWVTSGEIAIPEIQRPFVWDSTKVRNLLDSLYLGYPIGYLITWQNPNVRLKDGSVSVGKKILIDGQQRVTALMAALLGIPILTKEYKKQNIRIAYNPQNEVFEVTNSIIEKDPNWISDISIIFNSNNNLLIITNEYLSNNPGSDVNLIYTNLDKVCKIINNNIGIIELAHDLDIETVTEIFIRVNASGTALSQADFAMSKIAVDEKYGGKELRKAIDYFCHMAVKPEFYEVIKTNDQYFVSSEYFKKMSWLKNETDDVYDPSYIDLLRVAFTTEFKRGKLQDLVALISGRNFVTKQYEDIIIEDTFNRLRSSVLDFMNEYYFKSFLLILKSAGFINYSFISSKNAVNFAYILYLTMKKMNYKSFDIEHQVRKWYVFSALTGRYSSSPESTIDYDIKQIDNLGIENYASSLYQGQLSDAYWEHSLPVEMNTSVSTSQFFKVFKAAQVKFGDHGFLSKDYYVKDLIEIKSDVHHIFPKEFLKKNNYGKGDYNQIANYAITQSDINISIREKEPYIYMNEMLEQCNGGNKKYGNITDMETLNRNLKENCIPTSIFDLRIENYQDFLVHRRYLMAQKIKEYFNSL